MSAPMRNKRVDTMTRKEIVQVLARKTGMTKRSTEQTLREFEALVVREVQAGHSVTLTGFGTFFVSTRKARRGINPNTKESLQVPSMPMPRFRAGSAFKATLRKSADNT